MLAATQGHPKLLLQKLFMKHIAIIEVAYRRDPKKNAHRLLQRPA